MGGGSWDKDVFDHIKTDPKASAFIHDADVRSGRASACHDQLNPLGVVRESRDSVEHPESQAVAVLFDVTGSMSGVPRIFQQKLGQLMNLLIRKGYVEHPQILFGAIGDATCDDASLQVGQFESNIKMHEDLTRIYLEGGGGGQQTESYELGLYFTARHTSIDCYEKRGKKGYLFLSGDEMPYPVVKKSEVLQVIGDKLQGDIPIEDIIAEAREKYHVFFILPAGTSNYHCSDIFNRWVRLLGKEYVLKLQDPAEISELIAGVIGATEGVDFDKVITDVADASSAAVADHVSKALTPYVANAKSGAVVKTNITPSKDVGKKTRRL